MKKIIRVTMILIILAIVAYLAITIPEMTSFAKFLDKISTVFLLIVVGMGLYIGLPLIADDIIETIKKIFK